jgi:hypothetical protein
MSVFATNSRQRLEIILEFNQRTQMTISPWTNRPECEANYYLHCIASSSEFGRDGLMAVI